MHNFKDDKGTEWALSINVGGIKRVLAQFPDVDLLQIDATKGPDQPNLAGRLTINPLLTCEVIYRLLKPAADVANVSEDDFLERVGGRTMKDALAAFWEDITDFFQSCGRPDLAALATTQLKLLREVVDQNAEAIATWESERASKSALGNSSTDSPESSESTQTLTP